MGSSARGEKSRKNILPFVEFYDVFRLRTLAFGLQPEGLIVEPEDPLELSGRSAFKKIPRPRRTRHLFSFYFTRSSELLHFKCSQLLLILCCCSFNASLSHSLLTGVLPLVSVSTWTTKTRDTAGTILSKGEILWEKWSKISPNKTHTWRCWMISKVRGYALDCCIFYFLLLLVFELSFLILKVKF